MKKLLLSIIVLLASNMNIAYSQLSVVTNGDTTEVWDSDFSWNCAAIFLPITRISHDTIYITEYDTMALATCVCNYSVCTKLTGLDPGTYTAPVTRQWQYHQLFPVDTIIGFSVFVGSIDFTIIKTPTMQYQVSFYQSPCGLDAVDEINAVPNEFVLLTNYPNPFNPKTAISYQLPVASIVNLKVYDLLGHEIATLVNGVAEAGYHTVTFNAADLASGIYFYRIVAGKFVQTRKLVVLK
jgi:hypothetical protein